MDSLSFTTFLKIGLTSTTQGKFGLISRMHNSSRGYDFYKRMKLAAREVARGETNPSDILVQLQTIKRASERNHNIEMATRFVDWWEELAGAEAQADRPSSTYRKSNMAFGIRLAPELVYVRGTELFVTYLWATNAPRLTKQAAGSGLLLLRSELGKDKYEFAKFQIFDLRQKRMLGEECVTNQSASILQADIATINAMWEDVSPRAAA